MKEVLERIEEEVQRVNKTLSPHEHVKRFRLVADQWSPQTGEQSPTLKLRREIIYAKYSSLYEEIYGHPRPSHGKNTEPQKPSKYVFNLNLGLKFKPKDKSGE
jgi:long-chain acyl-CoA synthetase